MCLFRKAVMGLFSLLLVITAAAQTNYSKTLLWRISGNGLQKPSYLFGTIHLNDKRLFSFTDSLYKAIENTDGLAIEINPDEIAAYIVNKTVNERGKKLNAILSKEDFNRYSKRLSAKFNKPAEEITTQDIISEKNKWVSEYMQKGEMPTFVDAYLYSIARRQGKWVGGVEDMSDQANLEEDLLDKTDIDFLLADSHDAMDKSASAMMKVYTEQDLDGIVKMTDGQTEKQKDLLLVKRNIKMARRMDSLAAIRTMFFAVGAAHLPGEDGVIALLRQRGFTVEPVLSKTKIDAKDYKFTEVPVKWVDVKDPSGFYTASMPGNPAPVKLYGLMDMQFLLDLTTMSCFCTAAIPSPIEFDNPDSLFKALAKNMFPRDKNVGIKKIEDGDIIGRELTGINEGSSIRVRVFLYKKTMYMVMISGMKKETLTSPDAEKFLKSFAINKTDVASKTLIFPFRDSVMGISFMPTALLTYSEQLSSTSDTWKVSSYVGTDFINGAYIMLFSKEVQPGMQIDNEQIVLDEFYKGMQKQYINIERTPMNIDGFPAVMFTGKSLMQKSITAKTLVVTRANRIIMLMVIADSVHIHQPEFESMITDFHVMPVQSKNWAKRDADDQSFSAWMPSVVTKSKSESAYLKQRQRYIAFDTLTATSYLIQRDTVDKYFWAKSDSVFWAKQIDDWKDDDSLVLLQPVNDGKLPGREALFQASDSSVLYRRMRKFLSGNVIYTLYVSSQKPLLYTNDVNKFFTEFSIVNPAPPVSFGSSKAALLLNDILSQDSATCTQARAHLHNAPFTDEDIPLLHEALFKSYKVDTSQYYGSTHINSMIADQLGKLKNPATVAFIKEKYQSLTKEQDKELALTVLSGIHTAESYKLLGDLIATATFNETNYYTLVRNLEDSFALTKTIFPSLMSAAKDSVYNPSMASIALDLIDSGFIKKEEVLPFVDVFISHAKKVLPSLKKKDADYDYYIHDQLRLLGMLNMPVTIAVLKNYQHVVTDNELKETAVISLLKNGQQADPVTLNQLAADRASRSSLYSELEKINKKTLFPKLYLTQKAFAESHMYAYASDDDTPSRFEFISEKIASYNGKKYKFYLYKVTYGEGKDAESYLGIAGGYSLTGNELEPKDDITSVDFSDEKFKITKVDQQFKSWLKKAEKGEEEEE